MNLIKNIQEQFTTLGITDSFFNLYSRSRDFKFKLFAPFVTGATFTWMFYCLFGLHVQIHNFQEAFVFFVIGCIVQPLAISFLLAHFIPINSIFFKSVSSLFPNNRSLKAFIDSTDYQDNILSSLFDNKDFVDSLLKFYALLDNINFATSYSSNYPSRSINQNIQENYKNLCTIIKYKDNSGFVSFFKSKFIKDWNTYSQHDKVEEVFILASDFGSSIEPEQPLKNNDLIEHPVEKDSLKNKFKKVL